MAPPTYHIRTNLTPPETVGAISDAGYGRLTQTPWSLMVGAVAGGIIVGGYGHCCSLGTGRLMTVDDYETSAINGESYGWATILYGAHFWFAFFSIATTGTTLFTSDTLYCTTYFIANLANKSDYHKLPVGKAIIKILMVLFLSFAGNLLGTVIAAAMWSVGGAYLDSELSPEGYETNMSHLYLCTIAAGKVATHHPWGSIVANAVGANFFVALGTVAFKGALSHSGMLGSCAGPIMNFCIGSFQHVVANMYTLHSSYFVDCDIEYGDVWLRNMIPCTIGNMCGAALLGVLLVLIHGPGSNNYGINIEAIQVIPVVHDECDSHAMALLSPKSHDRELDMAGSSTSDD